MSSGLTRDDTNLPPPVFDARAVAGDPVTGMTQPPRGRFLAEPGRLGYLTERIAYLP